MRSKGNDKMKSQTVRVSNIERVKKLAGMVYHQGKSPEYWLQLTGVDPLVVPEVEIKKSGNKIYCYWGTRAQRVWANSRDRVRSDWTALGIGN